jgi:8-oxo-dGTP diphosphatase
MQTDLDVRKRIFDSVSAIRPLDNIEREHIDFALNWIQSGVEIFRTEKPAIPPVHLVSYFLIFSSEKWKVLLVDHKKAKLWLPPGGHVEIGEDPKETVFREAKEELGVEANFLFEEPLFLTVTKTVGNITQHTDVSLWYVLKLHSDYQMTYDKDEFYQIRWFGIDEIPFERSDPHLRRFIKKMIFQFRSQINWKAYECSAISYAQKVESLYPHKDAERFLSMIHPAGKIIDIGCGSGRDAKVFSEKGYQVTGIDFSFKMIEVAKEKAPQADFH